MAILGVHLDLIILTPFVLRGRCRIAIALRVTHSFKFPHIEGALAGELSHAVNAKLFLRPPASSSLSLSCCCFFPAWCPRPTSAHLPILKPTTRMFPLGYNVSEPIELVYKLYEIVESLRSAPESAKAFISKTSSFKGNLDELDRVLESELPSQPDQVHLRATVRECRACIKRCEEYSESFPKLTKDGRGKIDAAGQAARWAFQEKKLTRLLEEINTRMGSIGLALAIKTYNRTSQGSFSAPSGPMAPLRSGTSISLLPYSSSQPDSTQTESVQYGKTPADLLPHVTKQERKTMERDIPGFWMEPEVRVGKGVVESPQSSPATLCSMTEQDEQSELDSRGAMKALERRRNTNNEVAISPTGLGISRAVSEGSNAASQVFTSPTMSSGRSSVTKVTTTTSRRDSIFAPESAVVEMAMEQLVGVQVSYYKGNEKTKYPVSKIESCRNKQTGRRYIIISPPASSKTKLYFGTSTF